MRLVSAIWEDYGPFEQLNGVKASGAVNAPDELQPGDILVVHGGGDIHPSLYNKAASRYSGAYALPSRRDTTEWELMKRTVELKGTIIGICRGAQMLCALAGGYLIQHVSNHGGYHNVRTSDNRIIPVNSLHHQMMYPFDVEHEMLAWCEHKRSQYYYDVDDMVNVPVEPEFVYFPKVNGYAVQWHPEMMPDNHVANQYLVNLINERMTSEVV